MAFKAHKKMTPFVISYMTIRHGIDSGEHWSSLLYKLCFLAAITSAIHLLAIAIRSFARANNPFYKKFYKEWKEAVVKGPDAVVALAGRYDFDFGHMPVQFQHVEKSHASLKKEWKSTGILDPLFHGVLYCIAFGFARFLIYPGSLRLVNWMMHAPQQVKKEFYSIDISFAVLLFVFKVTPK
jgi:hypothetical protein